MADQIVINVPVPVTSGGQLNGVRAVLQERLRQDAKWGPQQHHDNRLWATILGEEFGEACQAVLRDDGTKLQEELVQVAAVALAWIEDLGTRRP